MISRTAQYALRALLYLARSGNRPVPASEIARAIGAPANYLSKTLNGLTHQGLVRGRRGPRGGYRLARRPDQIPLAHVLEAFDEAALGRQCLLGDRPCDSADPCAAHQRWTSIWRDAQTKLCLTTIGDLAEMPGVVANGTLPSLVRPVATATPVAAPPEMVASP